MTHNNRSVAENLRKTVRKLKDQLKAIETMVDGLVDHWRASDDELKEYYVDAYCSVQQNIKEILKEDSDEL